MHVNLFIVFYLNFLSVSLVGIVFQYFLQRQPYKLLMLLDSMPGQTTRPQNLPRDCPTVLTTLTPDGPPRGFVVAVEELEAGVVAARRRRGGRRANNENVAARQNAPARPRRRGATGGPKSTSSVPSPTNKGRRKPIARSCSGTTGAFKSTSTVAHSIPLQEKPAPARPCRGSTTSTKKSRHTVTPSIPLKGRNQTASPCGGTPGTRRGEDPSLPIATQAVRRCGGAARRQKSHQELVPPPRRSARLAALASSSSERGK